MSKPGKWAKQAAESFAETEDPEATLQEYIQWAIDRSTEDLRKENDILRKMVSNLEAEIAAMELGFATTRVRKTL